jgi:hypothetical protein
MQDHPPQCLENSSLGGGGFSFGARAKIAPHPIFDERKKTSQVNSLMLIHKRDEDPAKVYQMQFPFTF